jgi:hypothetical protein
MAVRPTACRAAGLPGGYLSKLLHNGRVVGYLAKNFQELLFEFQKITDAEMTAP